MPASDRAADLWPALGGASLVPATQIDDAVKEHYLRAAERQHSFETLVIDGESGEYCRMCGRRREALRKGDSTYDLHSCRGLVG